MNTQKFPNDSSFYERYKEIKGIKYYPYVGMKFKTEQKKIMIFAHNIYCSPEIIKDELERTKSPTNFSDDLYYYTYDHKKWTAAFRNFVKGSLALKQDYSVKSDIVIINKIDDFISKISFTNYINDLVVSNTANNVTVSTDLIEKSNKINKELISMLETTHVVCWGKNVFNHILSLKEIKVIERNNLKDINGVLPKNGFEYAQIELNGKKINLLKTFHPSMPSFGHRNQNTHNIFNWFYSL